MYSSKAKRLKKFFVGSEQKKCEPENLDRGNEFVQQVKLC